MANGKQQDIVGMLEDFFKKAPALPANIKETLVKIAPILALIFGILGVLVGLGAIGISPIAMFAGAQATSMVLISGVAAIISSGMMLLAYPGLKARQMKGWNLLFWSEAVSLLSGLLSGAFVGAIIGALIGFYLLFQIKSHYK